MYVTPYIYPMSLAEQTPAVPTVDQLLASARGNNPSQSEGFARHGYVSVIYNRPSKSYDVGTDARSYGKGKRSAVVGPLEALLKEQSARN